MRGVGDARAISALARLPERGLRGCAILIPSHFQRCSYSGVAGRGGGRGFGDSGAGAGEKDPDREGEEKRHDDLSQDEQSRWIERWKRGVSLEDEGIVGRPHQQAGGASDGRGRGRNLRPHDGTRDGDRLEAQPESQGRGRGRLNVGPSRAGEGRGGGIFSPSLGGSIIPLLRRDGAGGAIAGERKVDESRFDDATVENGEKRLGQGKGEEVKRMDDRPSSEHLEPGTAEPRLSAVEKLLAKLGETPSQTSVPPSPTMKPKLSLTVRAATEQLPVKSPSVSQVPTQGMILGVSLGRGRGQPGEAPAPGIGVPRGETSPPRDVHGTDTPGLDGSSPDRISVQSGERMDPQISRRRERRPKSGPREATRSPSPPRMPVEEAAARAMAILEQGIENNVAAEGERRRKAGMEKFADATEFFSDRFNRRGSPSPTASTSRTERPRQGVLSRRGGQSRRQRQDAEELAVPKAVEAQLTPEQEAELLNIQNEELFKDRLHTLFLTQFEPEYAMEEFGRNPDVDDPPIMPLEEYLQSHKPYFVKGDADLSEHQKWEEAVKLSLANAPNLEKLVEAYAGRGRMTARQQIEKLRTIHDKLPPTVPPEVAAFSQRAFLTLQNNPGLNMRQKERLMTNIVAGFSSL